MKFDFKHIPTLVIGLGGTGNEVARRLKAKFTQRYPNQESLIRYLIIDTDRKSFADGFWNREEQVFLRLSLMPRHVLNAFSNNEHADWMPQEPKISPDHFVNRESGAGLIRPIGRLYLQDQVAQVRDRLEKAKGSLTNLTERKRTGTILETGDIQVYLVASLAGGTGSGVFLDIAALVRELFEENCFLTGVFTLFSCYTEVLRGDLDQARRSKANCYAALKEIEFFMQERDDSRSQLYTIKFWDGCRINLYKRLFNTCYLVEETNDAGTMLNGLGQVYELCAQQLFHEIASPLGEDYRSKINNLSFFQSGLSGEEWKDWGRKRRFSSFGNVSLVYPKQKVLDYCTSRLILEVFASSASKVSADRVSTFFTTLGLDSIVLDEVLIDTREMMFDFRVGDSANDIVGIVERYQQEVERGLSGVKQSVRDKCLSLSTQWNKKLANQLSQCLIEEGPGAAEDFLRRGKDELNRIIQVYKQNYENCRLDLNVQAQKLQEARARLQKLGTFARIISGKSLAEELVESYNRWLDCRLEKESLQGLMEKLQEFHEGWEEQLNHYNGFLNTLQRAAREAEYFLAEIQFKDSLRVESEILIQEAVTKGDCENFYLKHKPSDIKQVGGKIWGAFNRDDAVTDICRDYFGMELDQISLVDFLRDKFGTAKEQWNKLLDELYEICRPYWTASLKHGENYNQTCLLGVCQRDGEFPPELVAWARERSDASRGIDCVNTYYPYSIDFTVSTHGAYAGYLSGIKDYYLQYAQFLRSKEFPLHLHEQFRYLPELDPDYDRVAQLFALAKSYGLIVQSADGFFFALEHGPKGWDLSYKGQPAIAWKENLSGSGKSHLPGDANYLGVARETAQSNLADNQSLIDMINQFFKDRIELMGIPKVKQELEEYVRSLHVDPEEGALSEAYALRAFLSNQLTRDRVYG